MQCLTNDDCFLYVYFYASINRRLNYENDSHKPYAALDGRGGVCAKNFSSDG